MATVQSVPKDSDCRIAGEHVSKGPKLGLPKTISKLLYAFQGAGG